MPPPHNLNRRWEIQVIPRTGSAFKTRMESDRESRYPEASCDLLNSLDFPSWMVAADLGGKMESFEQLLALLRVISRRDLTVAVAVGQSYLAAVHVWIAGTPEQKQFARR